MCSRNSRSWPTPGARSTVIKSNAEVLMATRSGSNDLHGSAYDFLQNAALDSRDYFDQANAAPAKLYRCCRRRRRVDEPYSPVRPYESRRTLGAGNTFLANPPPRRAPALRTRRIRMGLRLTW